MALNIFEKIEQFLGFKEETFNFYYINNSDDLLKINTASESSALLINSTNTHFVNSAIKSIRLNKNKDIYLKTLVCRSETENYLNNSNLVDFFMTGDNLDQIISFSSKINSAIKKFKVNFNLDENQIINLRMLRYSYLRSLHHTPLTSNDFYNKYVGPLLSVHYEDKSYIEMYVFLEKFKKNNYILGLPEFNLGGIMNLSSNNSFKFSKLARNIIFNNFEEIEEVQGINISSIQNKFISNSYFRLLLKKGRYSESLNIKDGSLFSLKFNCDEYKLKNSRKQIFDTLYNTVFEVLGENLSIGDYFTDINSEFFILLSNKYSNQDRNDLIKLIKVKILSEFDRNSINLSVSINTEDNSIREQFENPKQISQDKVAS